jgi:hypothetical protein
MRRYIWRLLVWLLFHTGKPTNTVAEVKTRAEKEINLLQRKCPHKTVSFTHFPFVVCADCEAFLVELPRKVETFLHEPTLERRSLNDLTNEVLKERGEAPVRLEWELPAERNYDGLGWDDEEDELMLNGAPTARDD